MTDGPKTKFSRRGFLKGAGVTAATTVIESANALARGSCSACTVWIDKTPALACMTLAVDTVGRKITTIEGLSHGDTMHAVQAAFVKHDAMQCGFCTPGMVMSCAALLDRNPNPKLDDVKHAVSGNLCRCGTYPKVFAATLDVAQQRRQAAGLVALVA